MKFVEHPIEELHEMLSYDTESGVLYWKNCLDSRLNGKPAGGLNPKDFYICLHIRGRMFKAHRVIWAMHYGEWPNKFIDHIDQCRSNNRIENLRLADAVENGRNRRMGCTNTSGALGVSFHKRSQRWRATIKVRGREIFLGAFKEKEPAVLARKAAEADLGFAAKHGAVA